MLPFRLNAKYTGTQSYLSERTVKLHSQVFNLSWTIPSYVALSCKCVEDYSVTRKSIALEGWNNNMAYCYYWVGNENLTTIPIHRLAFTRNC